MGKKKIAYINKDMLIWARGTTPFSSPEDVESRFNNISAEKLRKWENGEELPSITEAKELASKYKLPFACFYLSSYPEKSPKSYIDRRPFWDATGMVESYELWSEKKRICEDRETILSFLDDEEKIEIKFPTFSTDMSNKEIANQVREILGVNLPFLSKKEYGSKSYKFYRDLLENNGIIVEQILDVDLREMRGLSIYMENLPIIAINSKDFDKAKTFSLFHELAHIIRRSSSLCLIEEETSNDEEIECDKLAAEILMPFDLFRFEAVKIIESYREWNKNTLTKLADKFGVSIIATFRRLKDVGLISEETYYSKIKELKREFEEIEDLLKSKKEKEDFKIPYHVRFVNKHGILVPKTIIKAYGKGKIAYSEIGKIFNVKTMHINKIIEAVMVR